MKKIIATLALMIACQTGFAQNIETMFETYKNEQGADYLKITPLMMKLFRLFADKDVKTKFMRSVQSMKILDLGSCQSGVKESFIEQIKELNLNGYETLLVSREDGETFKLLAKTDPKSIKELLVLTTGKGDCIVVQLKGKIKKEDIQMMITDNKVMIDGRK